MNLDVYYKFKTEHSHACEKLRKKSFYLPIFPAGFSFSPVSSKAFLTDGNYFT